MKRVLHYGCASGRVAVELLSMEAKHITGIDISSIGVAAARRVAALSGSVGRMRFLTADVEHTGLPAHSFDLIIGNDVLVDLDLTAAVGEVSRLLKPGGTAIFDEPLGHRSRTAAGRWLPAPARATPARALTEDDWTLFAPTFATFRHVEREFVTWPLRRMNLVFPRGWQAGLATGLALLQNRLLNPFPELRRHAKRTVLVVTG